MSLFNAIVLRYDLGYTYTDGFKTQERFLPAVLLWVGLLIPRAQLLAVALSLLSLAGCGGLSVSRPASGAWQQAGGGAERSRVAAELVAPLAEAWQDNAQAAFGAESVVGGGGVVYVGTRQGEVLGYDVETGDQIGYLEVGDSVEGPIAVEGTMLYAASTGSRGEVQAHDLGRGKRAWRRKMKPIESGVLLTGGRVIVAEADGTTQALDARTGETIWSHAPDDAAMVKAALVRAGETVVVADVAGLVRALHLTDGTVAWSRMLGAQVRSTPAFAGGLLYVATTQGHLIALDATTGEERARASVDPIVTTAPQPVAVRLTAPAVSDGLIVVGGSDAVLRAYDASTLAPLWSHAFEDGLVVRSRLCRVDALRGYAGWRSGGVWSVRRRSGLDRPRAEPCQERACGRRRSSDRAYRAASHRSFRSRLFADAAMMPSARFFPLLLLAHCSAPLARAQDEPCRPNATVTARTVCLTTNLDGAMANGLAGLVRLSKIPALVPVDPLSDSLRVFPPSDKDWSVGQLVVGLEREHIRAQFPYHYRIESAPPGALIVGPQGDTVGTTPVMLVRDTPLASVELRMEHYASSTLPLDTLVWNAASVTLRPLTGAAPNLEVERWTQRSTRRGWVDAAALGLATVATAGAIYYKFEANRLYRDYERTGDPNLRPRIQRLDTRSGIALGAGQVGLGIFAFRLIRR